MTLMFDAAARLAGLMPPETAHNATIKAIAAFAPILSGEHPSDPILNTKVAGISFDNPLGLAAGFDKNAEVPDAMLGLGFGFVEVGAVTPRPQPGNDRPRVFRLRDDNAVINRYGFNNDGLDTIRARLMRRQANLVSKNKTQRGILGINLGANKDSEDRIEDYVTSIVTLDGLVDFFTVNISSPNTPGLRSLQDKSALDNLLQRVSEARNQSQQPIPVFLKIAPDLKDTDKTDIIHCVDQWKLNGLIVSNTTLDRPDKLKSKHKSEAGGLSGAPLFAPSTQLLKEFHIELSRAGLRDLPLIGVGGVSSAKTAYAKICAGASLVQLYTALIYEGPGLVKRILNELPILLRADGFSTLREAIGSSV